MASDDAYQTCVEGIHDISLDTSLGLDVSQYETPQSTPAKASTKAVSLTLDGTDLQDLDLSVSQSEESALLHSFSSGRSLSPVCNLLEQQINEEEDALLKRSPDAIQSLLTENNSDLEKHNLLLTNMNLITGEFTKIENLQKQMQQFTDQFRFISENLISLNSESVDLIGKLLQQYKRRSHILRDAQTQTDTNMHNSCFNGTDIEDNDSDITLADIDESFSDNLGSTSMEISDKVKHKLRKLPALIKGHLVRRLLQTETVQQLKRTIRDTSRVLINFKSNLLRDGKLTVTHEDILFHRRLCIQLENSCKQFYAIFFNTSKAKQMSMIAKHRSYVQNQVHFKERRANSAQSQSSSSGGGSVRLQLK